MRFSQKVHVHVAPLVSQSNKIPHTSLLYTKPGLPVVELKPRQGKQKTHFPTGKVDFNSFFLLF